MRLLEVYWIRLDSFGPWIPWKFRCQLQKALFAQPRSGSGRTAVRFTEEDSMSPFLVLRYLKIQSSWSCIPSSLNSSEWFKFSMLPNCQDVWERVAVNDPPEERSVEVWPFSLATASGRRLISRRLLGRPLWGKRGKKLGCVSTVEPVWRILERKSDWWEQSYII